MTKNDFIINYPSFSDLAENSRIVFEGRVSHKDAVRFIINCDCYIFIRISDLRNNAGFPTKFSEAFTLCRPVITTAISDLPSYFENYRCGELIESISAEKLLITNLINTNLRKKIITLKQFLQKLMNKKFVKQKKLQMQ